MTLRPYRSEPLATTRMATQHGIATVLGRLSAGMNLSQQEMTDAIDLVMRGELSETEIALFLTALRVKGETVAEIAGAAIAMRRHMTPIHTLRSGVVDTCGTGGDGWRTFNISTAAALVTAAAGVPVAKHGNRAISSRSGSADVLATLGVNIDAGVDVVERCLDRLGICFCYAALLHPAMRRVGSVRKQLGVATIFNLIGPLSNPAGAPFQVLGVGKPHLHDLLAEALLLLGTARALVVTGDGNFDEVTIAGPTRVSEIANGALREFVWQPSDFNLQQSRLDDLIVSGPEESAAMVRRVLDDEPGPARDIVVANAAAAIFTAGRADSLTSAAQLAADALHSGAARDLLAQLVDETNRE
jgi:anthranilate phosphoribosyltransferase